MLWPMSWCSSFIMWWFVLCVIADACTIKDPSTCVFFALPGHLWWRTSAPTLFSITSHWVRNCVSLCQTSEGRVMITVLISCTVCDSRHVGLCRSSRTRTLPPVLSIIADFRRPWVLICIGWVETSTVQMPPGGTLPRVHTLGNCLLEARLETCDFMLQWYSHEDTQCIKWWHCNSVVATHCCLLGGNLDLSSVYSL